MGAFDDQIAWLKQWQADSREILANISGGQRHFHNEADVTEADKAKAERDMKRAEALIAAYEKQNAARS